MKNIIFLSGLLALLGGIYFLAKDKVLPASPVACELLQTCSAQANFQHARVIAKTTTLTSISHFKVPAEQQEDIPSYIQAKYEILFTALELSSADQKNLMRLLATREKILSKPFYDGRSNSAEIEENLRQRDQDVVAIETEISHMLTAEDVRKFQLLKDSTYEQSQLNGFYQVAGVESLPADYKMQLLLGKLEEKQNWDDITASESDRISEAAPTNKPYLIAKVRDAFIARQEHYLQIARAGLNAEQFELLREYEQQLFDERWNDLLSSWQ